jgi:hypothetical protein
LQTKELQFVHFRVLFNNNEKLIIMNKVEEKEIIDIAVEQLNRQTALGAEVYYFKRDFKNTTKEVDAQLQLPMAQMTIKIECKKWINKTNLSRLLTDINAHAVDVQTMLVTEYINPNIAEQLKELGFQFLDTAGKAFQPKGMKVVFMLLTHPELVNAPMRTIANTAEVALGTVKQVMDDLTYQGFIVQKSGTGKTVVNTKALLDKWLDAYPANMHSKLNQTLFATDNPEQLKAINTAEFDGYWGEELAAERYDHYLKAKDFLIYLEPERKQAFLNAARLRKPAVNEVPDYKVIVVEPPFEIKKIQGNLTGLAHPLLVYANLVISTDPRNVDAAKRLYDEYLS